MEKPTPKYRNIVLSTGINGDSVSGVIKEILEINADDRKNEELFKDWETPPIQVFVNSFGGSVYDGLALYDVIRQSETPVHTIAVGSAMSMGLWIFMAGKKRLIGNNATLMFHDISTWTAGKSEEIKQDLLEMLRLQDILLELFGELTTVKKEVFDDYISRKAEWYIPAEEAIEKKFATGYYK